MYNLQKSIDFYLVLRVPNTNSQGKQPPVETSTLTSLKEKNSIYKLEGKVRKIHTLP